MPAKPPKTLVVGGGLWASPVSRNAPIRRVLYILYNVRFEWDDDKADSNRRKHGFSFEAAVKVFQDPLALFAKDRIVEGEQRWHVIGAVDEAVLLVVHVYRLENLNGEEENIRIISARPANERERGRYLAQTLE